LDDNPKRNSREVDHMGGLEKVDWVSGVNPFGMVKIARIKNLLNGIKPTRNRKSIL
jgi:hypothetical protein